jgi:TolB-like protein/Tfp pilus assembly protein PilF
MTADAGPGDLYFQNTHPGKPLVSSLIKELKRRSVLAVSTWYAVAAWLLLQVADVLVGLFGLPDWVLRGVLYFLIGAFPLLLIFFWARGWFSPGPASAGLSRFLENANRWLFPTGGRNAWAMRLIDDNAHVASVAVLPFRNLGGASDDFLADGLTEELLATLAKSKSLRVPSRTSCFHFKGSSSDVRDIAKALQVDHILEGSILRSDERIRVSAELVEAASDTQIWSETYERAELDELRGAIATATARLLEVDPAWLGTGDESGRTTRVDTYTFYLKGRFALNRATAEGCRTAVEQFEYALATDPAYARAHAGIAQAYIWLASYGFLPPTTGFNKARRSAEQALSLDNELAEAHLAIGRVQLGFDWDFAGAEASYQRALRSDSTNVAVLDCYGHLQQMMGRPDDAIAIRRRAVDIDPLSSSIRMGLADACFTGGQLDRALSEIEKLHQLDPDYPIYHLMARVELARANPARALEMIEKESVGWRKLYISAIVLFQLNERARAEACLQQLIDAHGDDAGLQIAIVYAQMAEFDRAFSWLERAVEHRDPGMIELKADPELTPLRGDARYRKLLERVGFPD